MILSEATTNYAVLLNSIRWLRMATDVQEWLETPLTGNVLASKFLGVSSLISHISLNSKRIQKTVQQRKLRLHMDPSVSKLYKNNNKAQCLLMQFQVC